MIAIGQPARDGAARIAGQLAWIATVLAAVSAVAGLFIPGIYRDTEGWIRQARAADFVTLLAVVPVLAISLWGEVTARGRLITLAALGYLIYTYAIFAFSVTINAMTPVHFGVLGLSTAALIFSLISLSHSEPRAPHGNVMPRLTTAGFLIVVSLLFGAMWLGQIADAVITGRVPTDLAKLGLPTNPVYALDLAFALPALFVVGVLLIRRSPRADEAGVAAVAWVALMGLGVFAIFLFDAMAGVPVPLEVASFVALITAVATGLTAAGSVRPGRSRGVVSPAESRA